MAQNIDVDIDRKRIPEVFEREDCKKHNAPIDLPCWYVHAAKGRLPAICNDRAIRAGFRALISKSSLGTGRFGQ